MQYIDSDISSHNNKFLPCNHFLANEVFKTWTLALHGLEEY